MVRYLCAIMLTASLWTSGFASGVADQQGDHVPQKVEPTEIEGFGVSLSVNQPIYSVGGQITVTLQVFNNTEQEITLHFRDAQRYEFTIEDEEGKEVWRWSNGRMFAQVLGEETLGPDRAEVVYTETYAGTLGPGEYKLSGILVALERPLSASLTITIG